MSDNSAKNILWCTYDGKVWFPSVYDQDGTFGMVWDGYRVAPPNVMFPVIDQNGRAEDNIADANSNILWNRLLNVFPDKIYARYRELRESVLSEENVISVWETFLSDIPESLFDADFEKWPHEKLNNGTAWTTYRKFDIDYIKDWYPKRLSCLDDAMEKFRDALCK